jgi:hypothetical protein
MAIDLEPLWDPSKPEVSEQRLRHALASATGDDALILRAQIARTYGLRGDFEKARTLLREIEPGIRTAGDEARARHQLELGRTFASATHPPELRTRENKERARSSFEAALSIARAGQLDGLAIDAIPCLPATPLLGITPRAWRRLYRHLFATGSQVEASIRNNLAMHAPVGTVRRGLAVHMPSPFEERGTDAEATQVAH